MYVGMSMYVFVCWSLAVSGDASEGKGSDWLRGSVHSCDLTGHHLH